MPPQKEGKVHIIPDLLSSLSLAVNHEQLSRGVRWTTVWGCVGDSDPGHSPWGLRCFSFITSYRKSTSFVTMKFQTFFIHCVFIG